MSTCLSCEQAPEVGRVVCSAHSGQSDASPFSPTRIFLSSMVIAVIIGAIIFGCYLGVQLIRFR